MTSKNWVVGQRHGALFTGGALCQLAASIRIPALAAARAGDDADKDVDVNTVSGADVLACACNERVALVDVRSGRVLRILPEDVAGVAPESICAFAASPCAPLLVTFSRNQLLRVWDVTTGKTVRVWKAHRMPVLVCAFEASGTLIASGGSDRAVMVWDVDKGFATHSFKGHEGIITAVRFQPASVTVARLVSASEDGCVRVWDLLTQACVASMKEHFAAVTCIAFSPDADGATLLTAGRDKIVHVWDTREIDAHAVASVSSTAAALSPRATIALLESVEGLVTRTAEEGAARPTGRASSFQMITCGDGGIVRKWSLTLTMHAKKGVSVACEEVMHLPSASLRAHDAGTPGRSAFKGKQSSDAVPALCDQFASLCALQEAPAGSKRGRTVECDRVLITTADHTLCVLNAATLAHEKLILGFNDEIVDLKAIQSGDAVSLAMATNSEQLRIINMHTFDATLCHGHTATILCVSVSPDATLVATGSKDATVRVWDVVTGVCLATCEGHTSAVSALAWPCRAASFMHAEAGGAGAVAWLTSGSADRTVKVWQLPALLRTLPLPRGATWTSAAARACALKASPRTSASAVAHDKDINAIAVAPNDKMFATGSQDKTIKLWGVGDLAPVATLRGHKRGVWAIAFSPTDQLLASASGDKTIRIWNVSRDGGYACLKTLEGHDASVLNVCFLPSGQQLMSAGADGLLKLWAVKQVEEDCVNTFDAHTEKVWALAVVREKDGSSVVVSGGGDSVLNVWHDVTSVEAAEEVAAAEAAMEKQQELFTAMSTRNFTRAVVLTLELDQPGRCGDILSELLEVGATPSAATTTSAALDERFRRDMLRELADMSNEAGVTASTVLVDDAPVLPHDGRLRLVIILRKLSMLQLGRLLLYVREWNTQSRHGLLAQRVWQQLQSTRSRRELGNALMAVREGMSHDRVLPGIGTVQIQPQRTALGDATALTPVAGAVEPTADTHAATSAEAELKAYVTSLLPYTERHLDRMQRLHMSTFFADYALASMQVLQPTPDSLLGADADYALRAGGSRRAADDTESEDEMDEAVEAPPASVAAPVEHDVAPSVAAAPRSARRKSRARGSASAASSANVQAADDMAVDDVAVPASSARRSSKRRGRT